MLIIFIDRRINIREAGVLWQCCDFNFLNVIMELTEKLSLPMLRPPFWFFSFDLERGIFKVGLFNRLPDEKAWEYQ